MFASSNIIYKRIANAYTRCRRITNPTKRLFNVPLDLWSLAKQESSIFFPAKIQQTGWSNLTFRSFRFFSFDKS
jgi:hypothetical protein